MKRYLRGRHPYHRYYHRRPLRLNQKGRRRWPWVVTVLFVMLIAVGGFLYVRPLPLLSAQRQMLTFQSTSPKINWPSASEAAFGTTEQGVLASKDTQVVKPTASTIKLLTVLTILHKKPLQPGEQGPLVPITQSDVTIYNTYNQEQGSVAAVAAGEQISEYQMLEGILLPSANNYADSLAIWAFGSLDNYRTAAQATATQLALLHTTVGLDASGFSPTTTSTAEDLTKLGIAAMKNPVVAQIVQQTQVNLPVAGVKKNVNWLLGQDGVVGVKTGNSDQVGGVFVFAATDAVDASQPITIIGAVQGEKTIDDSITQAKALLDQIKPSFRAVTLVEKGQVMAIYHAPWGSQVDAVAKNNVTTVLWPGTTPKPLMSFDDIQPSLPAGSQVGVLTIGNASTPLVTKSALSNPSWEWRLFDR